MENAKKNIVFNFGVLDNMPLSLKNLLLNNFRIPNFQVKSPTHSFASSSSGSYSVNNTENGKKISPPKETMNGKPLPPPIGTKPVTPPKPQTPPKPSKTQLGMATTEPLKPSEEPAGMAIQVVEFSSGEYKIRKNFP